jgi:hypothetical protein
VLEHAATVSIDCAPTPTVTRECALRVSRHGRVWFEDGVSTRLPYRLGLPPGTYRAELRAGNGTWAADFVVGAAPVSVTAQRVP